MSLGAGSKLGVYEVVEPIGAGGMGEVYRARDTTLGRDVAIKILRQEPAPHRERLRRFEQEARSASALNHPNIIHIYMIGKHESSPYIAMEYVAGRTLRNVLRDAPLPNAQVVEIATQIVSGLVKAHSAGIVHRDLKPENVMVADEGYVKILDFGLAKLLPEPNLVGSEMVTRDKLETLQGVLVGTVQYMSPEQAKGRQVDARSDQFSLGSILYEMATGKLAFPRESLAQTMAAIIEDEPEPVRFINSTVPTELVAIVERCLKKDPDRRFESTAELARELKAVPETSIPSRARRRFLWTTAGLLAAALAVGLGLNLDRSGPAPPLIDSLVVLPLRNASGDPEQDYFADGITEALITDLAKIGALKVIARTSAMRYKETEKPLGDIASELNVDAVVEGSALRVGERVRVTVQLVDVETRQALWAEAYERNFEDLLVVQSEVARAVADALAVTLLPEEEQRLTNVRAVSPQAYEAFLQGRFHLNQSTPQGLETAMQYFQHALASDPTYAAAHAGIGAVWAMRGMLYEDPREAFPRAEGAALTALAQSDAIAEAHMVLGSVRFHFHWDWNGAEAAFRRAIDVDPNFANAHLLYARFLAAMSRHDEAREHGERALELDPVSPYTQGMVANLAMFDRRYDEATDRFRRALASGAGLPYVHFSLWTILQREGRYDEAIDEAVAYFSVQPWSEAAEALVQGHLEGDYRSAMKRAALTLEARSEHVEPIDVAKLYAHAGEDERALDWLERGVETRDSDMVFLGVAPLADLLRPNPRYQNLLRTMNLPL